MTMPRTAFTEAELKRSAKAATFASVDPDTIFGVGADTILANHIAMVNPVAYHAKKHEYLLRHGKIRRPDSDFD